MFVVLALSPVVLATATQGCTSLFNECGVNGAVPTDVPSCCRDPDTYIEIPAAHCPGCEGCASGSAYAICTGKAYVACTCEPPTGFAFTPDGGGSCDQPPPDAAIKPDAGRGSDAGEAGDGAGPTDGASDAADAAEDASDGSSRKHRDAAPDGDKEDGSPADGAPRDGGKTKDATAGWGSGLLAVPLS